MVWEGQFSEVREQRQLIVDGNPATGSNWTTVARSLQARPDFFLPSLFHPLISPPVPFPSYWPVVLQSLMWARSSSESAVSQKSQTRTRITGKDLSLTCTILDPVLPQEGRWCWGDRLPCLPVLGQNLRCSLLAKRLRFHVAGAIVVSLGLAASD